MTTYEQALALMESTPIVLGAIIAAASPAALACRPSDDAWSTHQVLTHLLHVETRVIGDRIRQMLREDNPLFASVPPAETPDDQQAILDAWRRARTGNLRLLRGLTAEQLARAGRHPRYGPITVQEHAVEWAYHDLDHLRQILGALQAELYPEIGAFQALYPKPT
jgi:DinB superfamily